MLFQAPLLTALLQLLRMSLRPHLLHLHPHIQLEGAPKVKAMPAILCSRSKPCELLGWSYVGLYHSHEALTTTQSGYGTVVMCDQHRIGARWEQKRWSAGWMSAATTVVSKAKCRRARETRGSWTETWASPSIWRRRLMAGQAWRYPMVSFPRKTGSPMRH